MKKLFSLLLTAVTLLAILVSCGGEGDGVVPDGMKEASGEAAVYSLFIPEDWIIDMQTGVTTAHVSGVDASNVSLMVLDLEHTDDTVEDWWEVNLSELQLAFTDYTEVSIGDCKLGGVSAKDYVYTAKLGNYTHKYRQVAAVRSGTVYVLTYTATPEVFDSHLEDVELIMENFRYN